LFIDSRHEIKTGNDVVFLYLNVIHKLNKGVLIHIHDIFLPYDYPIDWVINKRWKWNEQYLVEAILIYSNMFNVIWAGHYLQKNLDDFEKLFLNIRGKTAKSLWVQKII